MNDNEDEHPVGANAEKPYALGMRKREPGEESSHVAASSYVEDALRELDKARDLADRHLPVARQDIAAAVTLVDEAKVAAEKAVTMLRELEGTARQALDDEQH